MEESFQFCICIWRMKAVSAMEEEGNLRMLAPTRAVSVAGRRGSLPGPALVHYVALLKDGIFKHTCFQQLEGTSAALNSITREKH